MRLPPIPIRGLLSPAQRERIGRTGELQEPVARGGIERHKRMAHGIALDDAARGHDGLRGAQSALPVLEIDQRQDAGIGRRGLGAPAGPVMRDNRLDEVGQQGARHRAGGAGVEIGLSGPAARGLSIPNQTRLGAAIRTVTAISWMTT